MLRRSIRLQEAGYYTEEGTPSISYKEISYRIFQRRTRSNGDQHAANQDSPSDSTATQASETRVPQTNLSMWIMASFLLFLILAFGIINYMQICGEMKELQQELHLLGHKVNIFLPQSNHIPNYALEAQGARVLDDLTSNTYWPQENIGKIWHKIFYWWYSNKTQRRVIQGHSSLNPGQCWPFSGEQGHLFISLSHPVYITHVTLGHISKSQSPNSYIASAPRKFSIYGMTTAKEKGTHLGTLVYDQDGASFQTFKLPDPDIGVFRYVKLQVESNWGNKDNTCVYSFRVHGKLPA